MAYSAGLKHPVIVDALVIAAGFVLRALAGVVVVDVEFSHWLLLCTILLALFLTFGKCRHELLALEDGGVEHRPIRVHDTKVSTHRKQGHGIVILRLYRP